MEAEQILDNTDRMMQLFRGQNRAYGIYSLAQFHMEKEGTKKIGKPRTVTGKVTKELWENHLNGKEGLGIIPIRDDSSCFFGAIDVDIYRDFNTEAFIEEVYNKDLPLVPCRSKSGGLHLYLFCKEEVPAPLMREKLAAMASLLGQAEAEIFPKQSEVLAERGDFGSWINAPYYESFDTDRYAYKRDLSKMSFEEFLSFAEMRSLSKQELDAYSIVTITEIEDGPPCLQAMVAKGIPHGCRNNFFFNLAVYIKKSGTPKGEMADKLFAYNEKYARPALAEPEIRAIVKTHSTKKEYFYSCNKEPLKSHCNQTLCKARRYGLGAYAGLPQLTSLTKFNTTPPMWFVTNEDGKRIELATEDLQNQGRFQRKCMEAINQMPPTMKTEAWQGVVQKLMENVVIIEAPKEASADGMFYEYLERFCTSRVSARTMDEILLGRPCTNEGRHFFRMMDLLDFMERQKFRELKGPKISMLLNDLGGENKIHKVKGKSINLWSIPEFVTVESPVATALVPDNNVM